jgi:tetratricopeptide (TPR) repeat protein
MLPELFDWARDLADDDRYVGLPIHALILAAGSRAAWRQGALDDVDRLARAGLAAAVRDEDRRTCGYPLAVAHLFANRFDEAAALWLDESGTRTPDMVASGALAVGYGGDRARAIELARLAVDQAVSAGAPVTEAFARYGLGEMLIGVDDAEAEANLRRAVELDPPTLAGFSGGVAHLTLVTLWQRQGDHDAALNGYHDLVQRWLRAGSRPQLWTTLRNLAFLLARLDEGRTALLLITSAAAAPSAPDVGPDEAVRLDQLRSALIESHGPAVAADAPDAVAEALAAIERRRAGV